MEKAVPKYRLVKQGEPIEVGDQVLTDDCETWCELSGWEKGLPYVPGFYQPLRRRVPPDEKGAVSDAI